MTMKKLLALLLVLVMVVALVACGSNGTRLITAVFSLGL